MLLVYRIEPDAGCEADLRPALRGLARRVTIEEGRVWIVKVDADIADLRAIRSRLLRLGERFPCLVGLRPLRRRPGEDRPRVPRPAR